MSNVGTPAGEPSGSSRADPIRSLGDATRRIEASSLGQHGVRTVRVLNETRFLSILERMVEERIRARLSAGPQDGGSTREELQLRWEGFRARYEEKLRNLEARLQSLAGGRSLPSQ
jgi:hypothetical protein